MSKKNKLLQRLGIVMLLMLTLCFGFVPDTKAAAAKDTTVEASIASTPVSKAAPAPYLTTDTMFFDKGSASQTTFVYYGTVKETTPSVSWISVIDGSGITVKVSSNPYTSTRTGKVKVLLTTGKELTITVKQYGAIRVIDDGVYTTSVTMEGIFSLLLPKATVDKMVTVESAGAITVTDNFNWISTSVVGKKVYINLAPNYNVKARNGSITISNGVSSTSLSITQRAFIPNPSYYMKDWTNYFGYYDWEQSIKNTSNLNATKMNYRALIDARFPAVTESSDGRYIYYSSSLGTADRNKLKNLVTALMKTTSKTYGIPEATVVLYSEKIKIDKKTNMISIDYGAYRHSDNTIRINEVVAQWDIQKVAETVFHEMRHKWQWLQARQSGSLIQYLLYYNFSGDHYIKPKTNFEYYEAQVVERDAREAASRMVNLCK